MTDGQGALTGSEAGPARDIARNPGVEVEFIRRAETCDDGIGVVARKEADLGVSLPEQRRALRQMGVFLSPVYQTGRQNSVK